MAKRKTDGTVGRRSFLKGATLAAAATAVPLDVKAANRTPVPAKRPPPLPVAAAETGTPPHLASLNGGKPGGDFMVDVVKSLGIEYLAANPGTSFRGFHESIINYGGNSMPEFLTCMHEEASVAMAHGYFKAAGKPLLVCAHGTVGLQHASMALYNAWCDRVPIYMMIGNTENSVTRGNTVPWIHSAQDPAAMVRDFTKWDDNPVSLQHFAESAVRGYKIAMTPPMEPVVLVLDSDLQEDMIPAGAKLTIPKLPSTSPPQGDSGAIAAAAKLIVAAENPVIVADRCARTPAGIPALVALAELLQCAVVDQGGRMNFPTRHPLNQTARGRAVIAQADLVLGLEVTDFYGTVAPFSERIMDNKRIAKPDVKTIHITTSDLYMKPNYQDQERFLGVDLAITGDAEATLPALTEAVRKLVNGEQKPVYEARGKKLAAAWKFAHDSMLVDATYAWDASPISTARLSAEIYDQIKDLDWCLSSTTTNFVSAWPQRLWNMTEHHHYLGGSGGYGIGYCAPAAVGAAVANKKRGRITVSINPDGDLMYSPGVLWTAAHHKLPVLFVMHNNRAYHQEIMGIQRVANRNNRGIDRTHIGVTITDPNINYAKVADGLGVYAEGPISDPAMLAPAIKRALAVVKQGGPALVDVVTQPR
jgi:acetolactate synthase I/II/III large subunit